MVSPFEMGQQFARGHWAEIEGFPSTPGEAFNVWVNEDLSAVEWEAVRGLDNYQASEHAFHDGWDTEMVARKRALR